MKKVILISLLVILLLIGGLLFFVLTNAEKLAQRYKPSIENIASDAVGASVSLGALSVNVFPSVHVAFDTLTVARSPRSAEKLTLNNLVLDIDTFALLRGAFVIDTLQIREPVITIVTQNGETWVEGLPRKEKPDKQPEAKTPAVPQDKTGDTDGAVPESFQFALNAFSLEDGQIVFKNLDTDTQYSIHDLDVDAAVRIDAGVIRLPDVAVDFTALQNIPVTISATDILFNSTSGELKIPQNVITIAGNSITQSATVHTKKMTGPITVQAAELDLASLGKTLAGVSPALEKLALRGSAGIDMQATLKPDSAYSARGTVALQSVAATPGEMQLTNITGPLAIEASGQGSATRAQLTSKKLSLSVNDVPLDVSLAAQTTPETATLQNLLIEGFGGTTRVKGHMALRGEPQFSGRIDLQNLQLDELLKAGVPGAPASIHGLIESTTITLDGRTGETLLQSLRGKGNSRITDGRIEGVNLARATLSALKLPFLENEIYQHVPEEFREYFNEEDTTIKLLTADWAVADKQLALQDFLLESSFYRLLGTGTATFDQQLDLNAKIEFSKDFSEKFAAKTREAKYLLNDNGQLIIPLAIQGTLPKVAVIPDTKELLKLQAGKKLGEKADKALGKLLGDKEDSKGASKAIQNLLGF